MSGVVHTIDNLARLVELRQREVDRRLAEIAGKQSVRERYQRNLDQLDALCQGAGATGAAAPGAALNSAQYKQTVLMLASSHRSDLAQHEADMAVSRQALAEASRQREVLHQLLARQRQSLKRAQASREQKRQDEMASQVWNRKPA